MTTKTKIFIGVGSVLTLGIIAYLTRDKWMSKKDEEPKKDAGASTGAGTGIDTGGAKTETGTGTIDTGGVKTPPKPKVTTVINMVDFLASHSNPNSILKAPLYAKIATAVNNAAGASSYTAKKGDYLGVGTRVLTQSDGQNRVGFWKNGAEYNVIAEAAEIRVTK